MLLLAALVTATPAQPRRDASASVRIERPSVASADKWIDVPKPKRREIRIRDEQGRQLLIRVIENE